MTLAERFWAKVYKRGPATGRLGMCWVWTASRVPDGYGRFRIGQKYHRAHRVSFYLTPHLVDGSQSENVADMVAKGRGQRGSRHARACLSEAEVLPGTIYGVISGKNWKHVGGPCR